MSARKESRRKTCAKCSKPLKRVKRYYRNGKFFCGRNCFRTYTVPEAKA